VVTKETGEKPSSLIKKAASKDLGILWVYAPSRLKNSH